MKKATLLILLGIFLNTLSLAQAENDSVFLRKGRFTGVSILGGTAYVGGITGLYFLWYSGYEQSGFHTINDNAAWLQVDKLGHVLSSYQLANVAHMGFRWAGVNDNKAAWTGGAYGLLFLTTVEVFDGLSSNWGFSWGDVAANTAGSVLFTGQQLLWHEQRIQLKFSYSPTNFAALNPTVLGENHLERALKDYNGQTYWLSINPQSFAGDRKIFPKWLNIAVGYGATGMINTYNNHVNFPDYWDSNFQRIRQFYLSLDLDLTKIKTRSEFLQIIFRLANILKFPMPTLEYNAHDGVKFHVIYF
jgi:uncharacterized protein YfiM (DUF2279 family)